MSIPEEIDIDLNGVEKDLAQMEKLSERLELLEQKLQFAKQHDLACDDLLEIYKPLVNSLKRHNELLERYQQETLLEDLEKLVDLNNLYVKKTKEQFDEIESLRAKLASSTSNQQIKRKNQRIKKLTEEVEDKAQKLKQRNQQIKKLNDKVDWLQEIRRNSRELNAGQRKWLKLYDDPRSFFEGTRRWYLKPLKYFFKKKK